MKLREIELGQNGNMMNQIIFHEKDKAITITGQKSYLGRWDLPSYKKVYESKYELIEIKDEGSDVVIDTKHQIKVEYLVKNPD